MISVYECFTLYTLTIKDITSQIALEHSEVQHFASLLLGLAKVKI